jgi:PIN domain nuclease of toxin-antitoxin system
MNLLLDTHIWIWSVGDRKRLATRVLHWAFSNQHLGSAVSLP